MAISKAYLCTKICEMAGHVRKRPELNALNKKELLIVFSFMSLSKDALVNNTKGGTAKSGKE